MNYSNQSNDNQKNMANISAFGSPGGGSPRPDNHYPGIGNNYGGGFFGNSQESSAVSNLPVTAQADVEVVPTATERAGLSSMLNMNTIKGFIDRMGGFDGIVSSLGKVQGFMKSVGQMAPMVKMLVNTFGKGGAKVAKASTKTKRKKSTKSNKSSKKKSSTKGKKSKKA
ncbi:aminotransferase [Paenibacillus albiflavus]|uniref:Aminotransferase n=1 Tax=Paenibacillus albiflavus TaxID=2545760 RepID=A0A4R4EFV4_9BACL|nr:aminotransferase [Paenibacillus albiflavus]TCZ78457.1 aminotransferase [Paenibacillus albiflavus]